MPEIVRWLIFIVYSILFWLAMAAGIVMSIAVVRAVWEAIRGWRHHS
ncbi:hypothetical protein ARMA_0744 [Ardenticatena maritima]|uniref:Uncharacterized protein n=1 Tax=Ardenticatena maritima TaxID=872965 RepID=A0A0M8K7E6_9CHLR|nr:hypothetical protein [Ardenticatena maritima]GAP62321.1 hypothetical protein ARMA_0744 [Ardenticatena maritima]